jgi:fused signal recognition particle receptor
MFSFFKKKPAEAAPPPVDAPAAPASAPAPAVEAPVAPPPAKSMFSPSSWFRGEAPPPPALPPPAPPPAPVPAPSPVPPLPVVPPTPPVAAPAPVQPPAFVATPAPAPVSEPVVAPAPPSRTGWLDKLKTGLRKTGTGIQAVFVNAQIDEALYEELEAALLMADTGVKATEFLLEDLRGRVKRLIATDAQQVRRLLAEAIADLLKPLEKPRSSASTRRP